MLSIAARCLFMKIAYLNMVICCTFNDFMTIWARKLVIFDCLSYFLLSFAITICSKKVIFVSAWNCIPAYILGRYLFMRRTFFFMKMVYWKWFPWLVGQKIGDKMNTIDAMVYINALAMHGFKGLFCWLLKFSEG